MCGIVGIAGNLIHAHREGFEDMLRVCQVRGRDSTGVFKIGYNGISSWAKRVGPPDYLLDSGAYTRTINSGNFPKVLVGHCRAKTMGAINEDNAHPFDFQNVIGVHNGTLRAAHSLDHYRDYEVDSQVLFRNINDKGVERVIPTLDDEGAWALVFWDKTAQTINFLRNDKRPLWFTHTKDLKVMAWASEPWMFHLLSRRSGIELWDGGDENKMFYQIPPNQLYTFEVNGAGKDGPDTFKFSQKELKGEVRGSSGNVGHNLGNSGNMGGSVVRPFPNPLEVARQAAETVRRIHAGEELNDEIPTFGRPNVLLLPPKNTPIVGGTGITNTADNNSNNISTPSSASSMDQKPSILSARERLSLKLTNLKSFQQEINVVPLSVSEGSYSTLKKPPPVSLRSVVGMKFITDNISGIEFEEQEFEKLTNCVCCYCKSGIGDLEEVNTIFVNIKPRAKREVKFTCNSCQTPSIA